MTPVAPPGSSRAGRLCTLLAPAFLVIALSGAAASAWAQSDPNNSGTGTGSATTGGPTTQADNPGSSGNSGTTGNARDDNGNAPDSLDTPAPVRQRPVDPRTATSVQPAVIGPVALPDPPGEFERYVQTQLNLRPDRMLRRFGNRLLAEPAVYGAALDPLAVVPGDYVIKSGDEVVLTIWGSAEQHLRLVVDRSGMIAVPRIGSISVAGLRYDELASTITRQASQVYRNFQLTATIGQVRAMRVYVAGYVARPGSLTVSGLASILHVVMRAGGPSAAGSFRDIHLRRGGKEIATFDLYDLLVKGDRAVDQLVQPEDVIFIGPVGPQVALAGSVNQQAIFEMKPGETLADLLQMAGGFSAVADRRRLTIERLTERTDGRVTEVQWPRDAGIVPGAGDLIRVSSAVEAALPQGGQNKRVLVEGEVLHPGDYVLPPNSTLQDAVKAAGGLTTSAYIFGTELDRESVRKTQKINYDRALRDLETDIARNEGTTKVTSAEQAAAESAQSAANHRLLERLRELQPTGRMVLPIGADTSQLPDLALEDGDRLKVPSASASVGVFGSVFNSASFVYQRGRTIGDYLALAGGPTHGADRSSIFVVRANGSVISARQYDSFWGGGNKELLTSDVLPGDTVFVPEELNKSTWVQDAKDWTQILYQFGLGLAGIKALGL